VSATVFMAGKRVQLDDRDLLGVGGEGRVFRVAGRAIKVFFTMTDARKKKLAAFPTGLSPRVIGPLDLCTDQKGEIVGYAMRALDSAVDIHRIGQRKWRQSNPGMRSADVLGVFRELSATVAQLHARGMVVGDLNDGNVVLTFCQPLASAGFTRAARARSASAPPPSLREPPHIPTCPAWFAFGERRFAPRTRLGWRKQNTKARAGLSTARAPSQERSRESYQPFEIFPSLWGKCLRQTGQNFLISNFSAIVRLFFVVT